MANLPVALSSLYQLPMITYTLKDSDQIAILTANADMLKKSQAWLNLEAKLSDHNGTQNSPSVGQLWGPLWGPFRDPGGRLRPSGGGLLDPFFWNPSGDSQECKSSDFVWEDCKHKTLDLKEKR